MSSFNLDNFKIGYFILYSNDGKFYGNLIEKQQIKEGYSRQHARFTHIEIALGGPYSINAIFPTIKINDDLVNKHRGRYIKILRPTIEGYDTKRKNVAIHCLKRVNKLYGLGILWFLFNRKFKNNFLSVIGDFCSELAGYGIWKQYIENTPIDYGKYLPKEYDKLYPADFSKHEEYFETIWEGYITD